MKGKEKFDNTYRFYLEVAILISNLILLFNSVRVINMSSSKKLRFW
jgi:hypothetical protein